MSQPTKQINTPRTILAFDFGVKRIGVAVGQELTQTASALTTLKSRSGAPSWDQITELIKQWSPHALVVGLPLNKDGTEHAVSRAARRFGNQLHDRYDLPVHWIDERLTSYEAQHILSERKTRGKKQDIDKLAAQLILQTWFSHIHSQSATNNME